jgi:hypothetical protein
LPPAKRGLPAVAGSRPPRWRPAWRRARSGADRLNWTPAGTCWVRCAGPLRLGDPRWSGGRPAVGSKSRWHLAEAPTRFLGQPQAGGSLTGQAELQPAGKPQEARRRELFGLRGSASPPVPDG